MSRTAHLRLPFFDAQASRLRRRARPMGRRGGCRIEVTRGHDDIDATCVRWVRALGAAGWLQHCVPRPTAAPMTRCNRVIW